MAKEGTEEDREKICGSTDKRKYNSSFLQEVCCGLAHVFAVPTNLERREQNGYTYLVSFSEI